MGFLKKIPFSSVREWDTQGQTERVSSVQFWAQDFERHKYGRMTKEGSEIKGKQVTSCEFHDEEFKALGCGGELSQGIISYLTTPLP